jgi:hypothetical protein
MILHNILIDLDDDALDDPAGAAAVEEAVAAERARREDHDGELVGAMANDHTHSYVKSLCEDLDYDNAYDDLDM